MEKIMKMVAEFGEEKADREGIEIKSYYTLLDVLEELIERGGKLRLAFRGYRKLDYQIVKLFEMGPDEIEQPLISEDFGKMLIINGRGVNPTFVNLNYFDKWVIFYSDGWVDVFIHHFEYEQKDDMDSEVTSKESWHLLFPPA